MSAIAAPTGILRSADHRYSYDGLVIIGDEAFTREEWAAIPHGSSSGYVHFGCRCDACRDWRWRYYDGKVRRRDAR